MSTNAVQPEINPLGADARNPLEAAPVLRIEHQEHLLTRMLEHQAAKVPSHLFLMAALCAMGISLGAELTGRQRSSRFIGMWVGPLLTMGVYNKMVKTLGLR
jgi:hypothetical protein